MRSEPFSLAGKVAVVTGASRGIGKAIALVFAQAGADLVLVARDLTRLNEVASQIRQLGRRALVCQTDVRKGPQIQHMAQEASKEFGRIDILVNNAGIGGRGSIEEVSEEAWEEVLNTNLKSVFLCSKAVAPTMRKQCFGRIISIASITAQTGGLRGAVNYSASKGGVLALTKTLARDMAPFNVTVNAIAPGQIETDMGRIASPEHLQELLRAVPLGRLGRPEDIAYAALFLASDEADYITGATLDVNGGILRR